MKTKKKERTYLSVHSGTVHSASTVRSGFIPKKKGKGNINYVPKNKIKNNNNKRTYLTIFVQFVQSVPKKIKVSNIKKKFCLKKKRLSFFYRTDL